MKENSPSANPSPATSPVALPWRNSWRWLISLFLMGHLLSVVAPPLRAITYGTGAPSPFATALLGVVRPYMQAMYLDHGYQFFAPEPGPLHLVHYKVEFADGRSAIEERFPNLQTQRPRLLYHRYFMLAEMLEAAYVPATKPPPPIPPTSDDPNRVAIRVEQERTYARELSEWQTRRSQYEQLRLSMIAHLEEEYPGGKVTLTRVRHRLLSPPEVELLKMQLDDPATYIDLPEEEPLPPAEVLP